jgi:hypothetical protein
VFPALIGLSGAALGTLIIIQTVSAARNAASRRTREFALLRMRGYRTQDARRVLMLDISAGAAAGALLGNLLDGQAIPAEVRQVLADDPTFQIIGISLQVVAGTIAVAALSAGIATSRVHNADPFLLASREN